MISFVRGMVVVGVALFVSEGASNAALLRSSFEGVVTARNSFSSAPAIGSTFSGQWTVDSAILGGEGPNCVGTPLCWSGPETSWTLNGLTFSPAGPPILLTPSLYAIRRQEVDAAPGTGTDSLIVRLGGNSLTQITLTLTEPAGNAFESASLEAFSSRQFSYVPLCVTSVSCATNPSYSGVINSISSELLAEPVPEPGSVGLVMFGGLLLIGLRRRACVRAK